MSLLMYNNFFYGDAIMAKITTDDCKRFIVQFQKDNPKLELTRFGITEQDNVSNNRDCSYLTDCLIEKNWKRLFKRKPDEDDGVSVYISGQSFNRYAEPAGRVNFKDIKCTRGFNMETAETQIAYLVFEMNDGTLRLGDYIGD